MTASSDPETRAFDDVHRYLLRMGRSGPQPPPDLPHRIMEAIRQASCRLPETRVARNGAGRNWRWMPATAVAVAVVATMWWGTRPSRPSRESLEARAILRSTHLEGQRWAWQVFDPGVDPLQREWERTRREVQHLARHIWGSVP